MRHFATFLTGALACGVAASTWFPGTKAVYNKWHETELERWLSDHSIPYPTPADRKDLENLVQENWATHVVPYYSWDTAALSSYLQEQGKAVQADAAASKDSLIEQVKSNWYETEDKAHGAYASVKDWILDTWTDSQLKTFCDKHGIPVPQPRHRDVMLQKVRSSLEATAKKAGQTVSYPGDWLWDTWSDSDLKEWLDTHGFPAPQPSSRDRLIASVRRNSRLAYLKSEAAAASMSADARAAYETLTDTIIDAWGDSQLKDFCDKNGIPVPQGTKLNELRALVRRHRAEFLDDTVAGSAASAFGAATSRAGNEYARATDSVQGAFYQAIDRWDIPRLRAYLDSRGVPIPRGSKATQLRALVRENANKVASGWHATTFDHISYTDLKKYLSEQGDAAAKKLAKKKDASRDDIVKAANSAYFSASKVGGANYASATNYIATVTAAARQDAFDTWTDSDLKSYLDSCGVQVPQGSKIEELKAEARKQATFFKYGTTTPADTMLAKLGAAVRNGLEWVSEQLSLGSSAAKEKAAETEARAKAAKAEL